MNVKRININDIGLSNRSAHALQRWGIHTVGDLLGQTEESITSIRNIGQKSLNEIFEVIQKYKDLDEGEDSAEEEENAIRELFEKTKGNEETSDAVDQRLGMNDETSWLKKHPVKIRELESLSVKIHNLLMINGFYDLNQIANKSADDLMTISRMDRESAETIVKACRIYIKEHAAEIQSFAEKEHEEEDVSHISSWQALLSSKKYQPRIQEFVQANDKTLDEMELSNRAKNQLLRAGYTQLSILIFVAKRPILERMGLTEKSVEQVLSYVDDYLNRYGDRLIAFCKGDDSVLLSDESVREMILKTYNEAKFDGFSLKELREAANIPEQVNDTRLKAIIGGFLADGTLEYVDFRCYRVYQRFQDYLDACAAIDDRDKEMIKRKLHGETLDSIGKACGVSRERVRQIIKKDLKKVNVGHFTETGMKWFDEDYYRYFFETYQFDKGDANTWLGIDTDTINYLDLVCDNRGTKDLNEAVNDLANLDYGFRLKIKNYLNRNKLLLDGRWIERKRVALEEYVVRKYCRDSISFEDFCDLYNSFLREHEIEYDEEIYYTDAVKRTRENKLKEARFLLWRLSKRLRFYDIDAQDYTELLDTLGLSALENIEYSTAVFMRDYPEIMEKYDIRDHYELHNLLKKVVKNGSYHDFHCGKMPMISFGTFDRDSALLDLLIDNAPISRADFADLIHEIYGYDQETVIGTFLQPFDQFYHQGEYRIDQKVMSQEHKKVLLNRLTDDFYFNDEIREIYEICAPDADLEEINPYNLKSMGFTLYSRYVLRNYDSLYSYFKHILTKEEVSDITPYRERFAYVGAFSATIKDLKKSWEVFEFEPNQIIHYRRLENVGVTRADLQAFCDAVCDYAEDGSYFSVQSLKKTGFNSDLFDELGFSDWFYGSLLSTDDRFSWSQMFGNYVLYKGHERITTQTFEKTLIEAYGSIDVYDLMTEMTETYGCRNLSRSDLISKVKGTDVYYDEYLDRLYANEGLYSRELDEMEG